MDKNKDTETDKIEQRRAETKARLDALKAKDGTKKPIKTGSRFGRILFPIIVVLLVLVVAVWVVFATGLPQRYAVPLRVGTEKVSVLEYNYYFNNRLSQFTQAGLLKTNSSGELDLSGQSTMDPSKTWLTYFREMTSQSLQETYIKAAKAKEAGMTLSEENTKILNEYFENLKTQFGGELEMNNKLVEQFGKGASAETLRPVFERMFLAQQYTAEHPKTYTFDESQINQYYDEHKDELDMVTYRSFMISPAKPQKDAEGKVPEQSEAEQQAAKNAARAEADQMLSEINRESDFNTAAAQHAAADAKSQYEADPDKSLQTHLKSSIVNKEVSAWLFDAARQNGDKAVVEAGNNYFVLYFVTRGKEDTLLPSVRHILFEADQDSATDEQKAAAKTKAEETLTKIQNESDMDSIGGELLKSGEAKESKLYEDVPYGSMVETFNDWIFDPARKAGDKGIVETRYGYHVMYYVRTAEHPVWYQKSEAALRADRFKEELDKLKEDAAYAVSEDGFGMRFVQYQ